jgi:hypothetical protein
MDFPQSTGQGPTEVIAEVAGMSFRVRVRTHLRQQNLESLFRTLTRTTQTESQR